MTTSSARTHVPTGEVAAWIHALRAAEVGLFDAFVDALAWNGSLAVEGLPLDEYARVLCRLPAADVARLRRCAARARRLPASTAAFRDGDITLAQLDEVGGITRHLGDLDASRVDLTVADAACRGVGGPDRPIELATRLARQLAAVADAVGAEDRQLDQAWLVATPRLFGGGRIETELDDEGYATVLGAIERAAGPPRPTSKRSQQLAEGLVVLAAERSDVAATATATDGAGAAPAGGRLRTGRVPRVVVHVDITDATAAVAGTLAWPSPGVAPTVTAATLDAIACDAELVLQLAEGAQPLARLRHRTAVTTSVRRAVVDRDRGCRFPGCDAPSSWVDVHHIVFRSLGGDHHVDNLVSLCRRHHRIVHRHDWSLSLDPISGELTCRRGPTMLTSRPRARAPDPPAAEPPDTLWDVLGELTPRPAWA